MMYELDGNEYPIYQGIVIKGVIHSLNPLNKPAEAIIKYSMSPLPWKILEGMDAPEGISFEFIVHDKRERFTSDGRRYNDYDNKIEPLLIFERIK